jgi:hypothetical protein
MNNVLDMIRLNNIYAGTRVNKPVIIQNEGDIRIFSKFS